MIGKVTRTAETARCIAAKYRMRLLLIASIALPPWTTAQAGPLLVAGSPPELKALGDQALTNNTGTAVGTARKYVAGIDKGERVVRWDATGMGVELGTLGTDTSGLTYASANAINNNGTTAGYAQKFVDGADMGNRPVRWDPGSTIAVELDNLGASSSGYANIGRANAINSTGTIAGSCSKYVGGVDTGSRAVRWNAGGTAATELGNLGVDSAGKTYGIATAINNAGTVVGYVGKYVGGSHMGARAVRWDFGGTTATALDTLGTDSSGFTNAYAWAINGGGTVGGYCYKYVGGIQKGYCAVRWEAGSTVATELDNLGADGGGRTAAGVSAINASGTCLGYAKKYDVLGIDMGSRAVRWNAGGTAITELHDLGTSIGRLVTTNGYAINDAGTAVGCATYINGLNWVYRAVIWLPDASAVDLNDLGVAPVPAGGTWRLTDAKALSADGWVAGRGVFDPDGAGPKASYNRYWLAQIGLGGKWTNPTGGTWGRGPNWSTGTPAMQVGDATFDLNSAYTVALDRNENTKTIAIAAGTVTLDFSGHTLSTESGLSIAAGAKLKGAGGILSNIVNAGSLSPGSIPSGLGTLEITGDLSGPGSLEFEIGGPSLYDRVDLSGIFTAAATIKISLLGGYVPADGDQYDLMDCGAIADNGVAFDFTDAPLPPSLKWDTSAFASSGTVRVVPVPEPATATLLGAASLALLVYTWRQRRAR